MSKGSVTWGVIAIACLLLLALFVLGKILPPGKVSIVGTLPAEDVSLLTRSHSALTRKTAAATARRAWTRRNWRLFWAASTYWIYPKRTHLNVLPNGDVLAGQFFQVTESSSSGTEATYTRTNGSWILAPDRRTTSTYSP